MRKTQKQDSAQMELPFHQALDGERFSILKMGLDMPVSSRGVIWNEVIKVNAGLRILI